MDPIITFPMLPALSLSFPSHFTVFGHTFYWYGLIIACGFLLAVWYCLSRAPQFGIRQDDFLDVILWGVPLGIVGARAYYVIFYGTYDNLWDMCKIWEGGLAIYGGVIAAVIVIFVFCRRRKLSALATLDLASFGLLIGQSVGRWGNFTNREAYGYETDVFCRMGLTYADGSTVYVHPCFLYESLWNAVGLLVMHLLSKKTERKFDGQYFLYYIGWYGLGRAWIEGLRADSLYIGSSDIRVSQVLAIVCFIAAVAVLVIRLKSGRCSPEQLFVNRVKAAEAEAAEAEIEDSADPENASLPAELEAAIDDFVNKVKAAEAAETKAEIVTPETAEEDTKAEPAAPEDSPMDKDENLQ